MENKKLAFIFIVFSVVFLGFLIMFNLDLSSEYNEFCVVSDSCQTIQQKISFTHIGFGIFGFMLGLGFYILLFNKSEEAIFKRLEEDKNNKIQEEKFDLISRALDEYERKVLKAIKEQDGITQSTLRLRTNLSKAKLSYVLQELEKRNLIKRIQKGKTLSVWLRI
jgi:ribosomal protein S25